MWGLLKRIWKRVRVDKPDEWECGLGTIQVWLFFYIYSSERVILLDKIPETNGDWVGNDFFCYSNNHYFKNIIFILKNLYDANHAVCTNKVVSIVNFMGVP